MVRFERIRAGAVVCIALATQLVQAQHRVDSQNMYERVLAVVSMRGSGTHSDPKRPMFAPAPGEMNPAAHRGILGYQFLLGDDGVALVEFVVADRQTVKSLQAAPSITAFVKGVDSIETGLAEFKKHKEDFDFSNFHPLRVQ